MRILHSIRGAVGELHDMATYEQILLWAWAVKIAGNLDHYLVTPYLTLGIENALSLGYSFPVSLVLTELPVQEFWFWDWLRLTYQQMSRNIRDK